MERKPQEEGVEGKLAAWLVIGEQPGGKTHWFNKEAQAWQSGRLLFQGAKRDQPAEGHGMFSGDLHWDVSGGGCWADFVMQNTIARSVTSLLQLRVACCLAKEELYVQHFKEVQLFSGYAVASSGWDNHVSWFLKQQNPELLTALYPLGTTWRWNEALPGKMVFLTGEAKKKKHPGGKRKMESSAWSLKRDLKE